MRSVLRKGFKWAFGLLAVALVLAVVACPLSFEIVCLIGRIVVIPKGGRVIIIPFVNAVSVWRSGSDRVVPGQKMVPTWLSGVSGETLGGSSWR